MQMAAAERARSRRNTNGDEPAAESSREVNMTKHDPMLEARLQFTKVLGLSEPISETALRGALEDPLYAHHLLVSRDTPEFLRVLLATPPQVFQEEDLSSATLATRALKAVWKWAKTGFTVVDAETYRKRLEACSQCPNLRAAPDKAAYTLLRFIDELESKVCIICGC